MSSAKWRLFRLGLNVLRRLSAYWTEAQKFLFMTGTHFTESDKLRSGHGWIIANIQLFYVDLIANPCHRLDNGLIHLPLMPHICIKELGQHWFRWWLVAWSALCTEQATSHHLNQCWPSSLMHIYYLNQWWLVYWCIYASLDLHELNTQCCSLDSYKYDDPTFDWILKALCGQNCSVGHHKCWSISRSPSWVSWYDNDFHITGGFFWGIHWSLVGSSHKGASMRSHWTNRGVVGDLRCHGAHLTLL